MYSPFEFSPSLLTSWLEESDPEIIQGLVETALHRAAATLPVDLLEELGAELSGEAVQLPGVPWLRPAATTGGFECGSATFEITRFVDPSGIPATDTFFIAKVNPWWDFGDSTQPQYFAKAVLSDDPERNRSVIWKFLKKEGDR